MLKTGKKAEYAVIVGLGDKYLDDRTMKDHLDELAFLAKTARIVTKAKFTQKLDHPDPRTFIGKGKLQQIKELLEGLDDSASVSITSADQLTRELFTYRGAGTLVRRGEAIELHEAPEEPIATQVRARVEESFGRTLRENWWPALDRPSVLLSRSRRAAAVVVRGVDDLPYLDKFSVTPDAQGEGLGAAMWQVLRAHYPTLYWRSRNANPITGWYFQQAESSERRGPWVVFTNGIEDYRQRERVVRDALVRDSGWAEEST
jgi:acetylglutamate kinase